MLGEGSGAPRALVAAAVGSALPVFHDPEALTPALSLSNPTVDAYPLVLPVTRFAEPWLEVRLPIRPNNRTGWVKREYVALGCAFISVRIELEARILYAYYRSDVVLEAPIAVGKDETPTPLGTFFVVAKSRPRNPAGGFGWRLIRLSGFSEVLNGFAGSDAQIGIHGTNVPQCIGHKVTHGCVRMHNEAVASLAGLVTLGSLVKIVY